MPESVQLFFIGYKQASVTLSTQTTEWYFALHRHSAALLRKKRIGRGLAFADASRRKPEAGKPPFARMILRREVQDDPASINGQEWPIIHE